MAKVYTKSPYDYNEVALKKRRDEKVEVSPTVRQMMVDPGYNLVGKFLGVATRADWSQFSDKVDRIVKWAKRQTGSENPGDWIARIREREAVCPTMNERRVTDIYVSVMLDEQKKTKIDYNGREANDETDN